MEGPMEVRMNGTWTQRTANIILRICSEKVLIKKFFELYIFMYELGKPQ